MGCVPSKAQLAVVMDEKTPVEAAVIDLIDSIREDSATLSRAESKGLEMTRLSQIFEEPGYNERDDYR
eukprot:2237900-Rhodomonas_salina.2